MDAYPPEYFTTPLPLLLVAGLGSTESHTPLPPYPLLENGTLISCDEPLVTSKAGQDLLQAFFNSSAESGWKGTARRGGRTPNSPAFRVAAVGRNFALPPRKANPPSSNSVPSSPLAEVGSPRTPISSGFLGRPLHSPLSPLSPDSPLYPDGVFSHIWLRKHLYLQPCAFVSFHEFAVVPRDQEDAADRALAASINEMKKVIAADSRKIKFAVVLIAQKPIVEAPTTEDRFALIRRLTSLDTKSSLFFVPAKASFVELQQLAKTLQLAITPTAIEFYRELSKHARRKRNRSSIPPPTVPPSSISHPLSNTGWTARYEIKLALFAEFRGEVDVAVRNYETAYEAVLEVFETTNNWSSRWNDIRLLADVVSARIIRCYLYLENTTLAARRWENHRRRMADILDRKGAGTSTYGWAAWQSRWAVIMATSAQGSQIFTPDPKATDIPATYAPVDKAIKVDDKVSPIEHLHHPGFYWNMAVSHCKLRQRRVGRLPESDAPVDLYLVSAPEEEQRLDHSALMIGYLNEAASAFEEKGQSRFRARALLEIAQLEMKRQRWQTALDSLKAGLRIWRRERWTTEIIQDALFRMRECALQAAEPAAAIVSTLELHSSSLPKSGKVAPLDTCLADIHGGVHGTTSLAIKESDMLPVISVEYAFRTTEASVGEPAISQLVLNSLAQPNSSPLVISEIKIEYKGNLKTTIIRHEPTEDELDYEDLKSTLKEGPVNDNGKSNVEGIANLSLYAGQPKILEISGSLRESGEARATSITLTLRGDGYDIDILIDVADFDPLALKTKAPFWYRKTSSGVQKVPLKTYRPAHLKILPKPPRLMVKLLRLDDPVYVGEPIQVILGIVNEEDEEVDAQIKVRILGYPDEIPLIRWDATDATEALEEDPETPYSVGIIPPSEEVQRTFTVPSASLEAEVSLEIVSLYVLTSDRETQISKSIKLPPFHIRRPFRTKFDFSPSVHPDRWLNMFRLSDEQADFEGQDGIPKGLTQKWIFKCQISLLEEHALVLDEFSCGVSNVQGGISCQVSRADDIQEQGYELEPSNILEVVYILEVTKRTLEDRRTSDVDLELKVKWRRPDGHTVITPLAVPRLLIPGSEPRVLAEASPYSTDTNSLVLTYTLENPTMHVLTFHVSMEPNETFLFEGPKQPGVQIMPLSRYKMEFRITPRIRHDWIKATLKVVDKYYNKNLRIAATDGVKSADRGGVLVWIP